MIRLLKFAVFLLSLHTTAFAQANSDRFTISGTVRDASGAGIPDARVIVHSKKGAALLTTKTDIAGSFSFSGIAPGQYYIEADSPDFERQTVDVSVLERSPAPIHITLTIAGVKQEVIVHDSVTRVSTDSSDNLDVVTLDRGMLDNLPIFDQNYVAAMAQFLDPGSIGTNGVTLVVNGMEQKNIGVSASAIQQVKINQNPYSAEFSRPGRGRIEVITKPASQDFHGTFNFLFRDYHLNARDPFAVTRPPEQRRIYEGSLIGPLGRSGKNSFLLSFDREEQDLQAIVFADAPSGVVQQNVDNPQRDTEFAAALTHEFSQNHVATIRSSYHDATEKNRGAGGFVLPEAAVNFEDREDEIYYNDSLVLSPKLLNQFRVLIGRQHSPATSVTNAPGIVVTGSFTGGGAQANRLQTENHMNLNDVLSWSAGKHQLRAGINVPDISRRGLDDNTNVLGTYSFSTLADYLARLPYSFVQQRGDGHIVFLETVVGGFFQDEYRVRPNLTVSAGIRYDWQNYFHANRDISPRVSFAYAPAKDRKTVFRGGAGIFYDRTGPGPIFDLERYNGFRLSQVILTNPVYPVVLDPSSLASQPVTLTRLDPSIRMPYTAQFSMGVERQLYKGTTLSATYWAIRGVDLFRSREVNAPPPPDYSTRPIAGIGVFRQIESSGHLQSDAMDITFRGQIATRFKGMVQYTLGRAYNDVAGNYSASTRTVGINAFPANNYDLNGEWARGDYDQRHRLNLLGTIQASKYLDFGVGVFANTGAPYTETTGRDDFHTGFANARPPGVARNSLQGPGFAELDLRWSHDFAFTGKKEGPRLTTALDAFNVTNKVNYVTDVGNLSSPFFGEAVAAKPVRRLQFSLRFSF